MAGYCGAWTDLISLFHTVDVNQFSIITELLGTPPDDVIKTIGSENVGRSPLPKELYMRDYDPQIIQRS